MRVAYYVSHPIQYQAPLLRRLAAEPWLELNVLFGSDFSVRPYADPGFGTTVAWDTPLLEGYQSEVLEPLLPWRKHDGVSATRPLSRGIKRRLRELHAEALWVHGYASINSLRAILAANALGIPVLLRAESWLGDRPRSRIRLAAKRLFFRWLRRRVAAVLPIGTANAAYWREYLPDVPQFLMPYTVDNEWFAAQAAAANCSLPELRRSLALDAERPVILFASKLQPRKRAADLLTAFHDLLKQPQASPAPCLVIAGDGEEFAALQAQHRALSGPATPPGSVIFAGFRNQSELPAFFALASVFVLPSEHEPWGLVVNEAMASGCAVILSSDVGCHIDLVTGGREGLVYPTGDVAALTAALQRVCTTPGLATQMAAAAGKRIAAWSFTEDIRGLERALQVIVRFHLVR